MKSWTKGEGKKCKLEDQYRRIHICIRGDPECEKRQERNTQRD